MANQFVQQGEKIDFTPSSAVAAGTMVLFGERVFFAELAIPANTLGSLRTTGVVQYEKTTGEAWTVGQKLYWNAGTSKLTTTSSTNKVAGYAAAAAASGAVEGLCLLGQ